MNIFAVEKKKKICPHISFYCLVIKDSMYKTEGASDVSAEYNGIITK